MAYIRKIRIEYYQVVRGKKDGTGKDILYNLEDLILKAKGLKLLERTYKYYQEDARLDKIKYHRSTNCYYLNFVRLRQTKLPVMAKKNSESTPLKLADDEYIGEDVSAVYDQANNILVLQRNRDSLSSAGIEFYLTELFGSNTYGIYLRPVPFKGIENKLKKAKGYRKITMKLATDKLQKKKIPNDSSFNKLLKFINPFEAKSVVLTVSMGHYKGTMSGDTITDTIHDIRDTDGLVTGAELSVKYNDVDPVDTIDLFAMKYHNFISLKIEARKSIDYIELCNEMRGTYLENKADIKKAITSK
jgi:hypothetical protein